MASAYGYFPSQVPYSTVQSSMNNFMGTPSSPTANNYSSSPIQYNMPLDQLRQQSSPTTLNGPISSSDRIQRMSDRAYEKWKANAMFRDRVNTEYNDAINEATQGLDKTPNDYNAYQQFMSNTGAAGLLGGSTVPVGQRMMNWNQQLFDSQKAFGDAVAPVYSRFGMTEPQKFNSPLTSLQNTPW